MLKSMEFGRSRSSKAGMAFEEQRTNVKFRQFMEKLPKKSIAYIASDVRLDNNVSCESVFKRLRLRMRLKLKSCNERSTKNSFKGRNDFIYCRQASKSHIY